MRLFILAVVLVTTGISHADSTLPGGATIQFNRLFLHEHDSAKLVLPEKTPDSLWRYFNYAHCVCGQSGKATRTDFLENSFAYELLLKNQTSLVHRPLEIWVGASCDDPIMRPTNCHRIDPAGIGDIASIATTNGVTPEVPVFDLMNPEPNPAKPCPQRVLSATEWAIADGDSDGTPDYFSSQAIATDSLPPPLPTEYKAAGAESAIELSWTAPTGDTADIAYYQALCASDSGSPGRSDPPAARYVSPRGLCGADADFDLTAAEIASPDATDAGTSADVGADTLVDGLKQFDAAYICGESAASTATSLRLEHLRNGEPYTVVLLAIDKYGNAKGAFFTKKLTPQPATDFWEDLHSKGSQVQGGVCLIAETYGDNSPVTRALRSFRDQTLEASAAGRWLTAAYYATLGKLGWTVRGHVVLRIVVGVLLSPIVGVALLWHAITLPGILLLAVLGWVLWSVRTLRHRRTVIATWAGAALALAYSAPARAQSAYWNEPLETDNHSALGETANVEWHVGVRVGPYTPQIDAEPGLMTNTAGEGPYRAMFGGYRLTPIVDIDRIMWSGIGQLGIGLSIGYMGKTAHSYAATVDPLNAECMIEDRPADYCIDPQNPNRIRSKGDRTSFRLIPLELTALYRFSYLDDEFGIPLVPYVRGGLGYYIWWSTAPNGKVSIDPTSSSNKARGASAGLVGAVGLQIRAERIDPSAARSMTESGIAHAGFYGEYSVGWISGFGDSTKLNVGDKTWFAGVDFEF